MNNTEFLGNADIKTAVSRMLKNKKLTHSFVITGDKGLGKKTAARYIGAAVLCENNSDGTPCMQCKSCKMTPTAKPTEQKPKILPVQLRVGGKVNLTVFTPTLMKAFVMTSLFKSYWLEFE